MPKLEAALQKTEMVSLYRQMMLLRQFEEKVAEMYTKGHVAGFCHLYIGQEAVAVGAISALEPEDYVISAYREHGQALAKGCEPNEVMAELFGKATGLCGGRGGSMHLFDLEKRFMGGFAIVAGQLPLAVGLGLAIDYQKEDHVVLCFFGDGAVNEGAFHESLNLAKLWNLPVIFICENNLYGMGTPIERATSLVDVAHHGCAYGIPGIQADGMDVLAMRETVAQAVEHARTQRGPYLIEALTYRYRGHSMADPLKYRTQSEVEVWQSRDPLRTFSQKLLQHRDGVSQEELEAVEKEVAQTVAQAVAFAQESPDPPLDSLMKNIYVEPSEED